MTRDSDSSDALKTTSPETPRRKVKTEYKFSHVTTGRYLPLPGKAPGWPFAEIGHWKIDVNSTADDWIAELIDWRREHLTRIGYDDANYRRPELQWAQRNFVHAQMMVEDRYFYDPVAGKYTVDRYLDDLEQRFGGIDSVLIWFVYPNIGIDDRNKTDLAHDLPGGIEGLRGAVEDFHRRGVRVFLPTMPWDNGTRPPEKNDWQSIADLVAAVGADGVNGDTYNGVPRAFFDACDALGHPVVLQPESTISAEEQLIWNVQSWGKKVPADVVPSVAKFKWLEPRHMINYENRWGRDRTNDLQYIFFNGVGYNAWENIWGIWNQLTPRDAEALRRIAAIERKFAALMVSMEWRPYEPTLQAGVFASRFPGADMTLWTLVNRNEYTVSGEQIAIPHDEGVRYFDAWNGVALQPRLDEGHAVFDFRLEGHGFGAVLALAAGVEVDGLEEFLADMRERAATPLQSFSNAWRSLPQHLMPIEPTPGGCGSIRHGRDSGRGFRFRRWWSRDRRPDLGRHGRAISLGGQPAARPSPAHADATVLHRSHAGDQRAVQRIPRCQRLSPTRCAQLPAPLARWRAAGGTREQARDLGFARGRARLRTVGRQAPATRMGMAVCGARHGWATVSLG